MNLEKISLEAIEYAKPTSSLTTESIEDRLSPLYERLKLPFGRIEMQTGVKERGIYPGMKPSDISTLAAKELFSKNPNIKPEDIDLLIHASVCRDFLEPSTASVVHHHLGLRPECMSFDLSNACLGVVSAIATASKMIEAGAIKKALIVTGENSLSLLENTMQTLENDSEITRKGIKKFFANFTIGSAGVALVLTKNDGTKPYFTTAQSLTDSSAYTLCQGDTSANGLVMETQSEELMQAGIKLAKTNWKNFLAEEKKQTDDFDHFICHQVGIHHRDFLYKSLELDLAKDHTSFDHFGNTGSAALPLTLALAKEKQLLKPDDHIALLGIGSGLHTITMGLKWR